MYRAVAPAVVSAVAPFVSEGGGAVVDTSLKTLISSCVYDLDVTKALSYSGTGQTWTNLVVTPADGAGRTSYDFQRGMSSGPSTDDPTFNGTAGNTAAYWGLDGGDVMSNPNTPSTFLNLLHKASQNFTVSVAMKNAAGTSYIITLDTLNITAAPYNGIVMFLDASATSSAFFFAVYDNNVNLFTKNISPVAAAGTNDMVITVVVDKGGSITLYKNKTSIGSVSLSGATWATSNLTAGTKPTIFARDDLAAAAASGSRAYAASAFNTALSVGQISTLVDEYSTRHGRVYS